MPNRYLVLLPLLAACASARAETTNIVITRQTGEQYNQTEKERDWRETEERKRREAQAISLRDQERERAETAATRAKNLSELERLKRESALAEQQARAAESEARRREIAAADAVEAAKLTRAEAAARSNDLVDVEREVRRHVRDAALAEVKAGKITRAEAARRMRYSTPVREAILEDFKAGRIDKPTALSRLAGDDRGVAVPTGGTGTPAPRPVSDTTPTARPLGDPSMTARREAADAWLTSVFGGADKVPATARAIEYARLVTRTTPFGYENPYLRTLFAKTGTVRVLTDEDRTLLNQKILAMRDVMDALRQGDLTPDDARTNLDVLMSDIKAI